MINISDSEVLNRLVVASQNEHKNTVEVLIYLGEVDKRRLYAPLGYSSMFNYCTKYLKYSEPGALRRIKAARCIREFPEVLVLLQKREINLSAISLVAGILERENSAEVLEFIKNKTHRQVEDYVVLYKPSTRVREKVTPINSPLAKGSTPPKAEGVFTWAENPPPPETGGTPFFKGGILDRGVDYKVQFKASAQFIAKFNKIKSIRSHCGNGSFEEVFEFLMDRYLDRKTRRSSRSEKPNERYIPAALKAKILERGQCCTFVGANGKCGSTHWLEIDHIVPFGMGGKTEESNLRVLCQTHNRLAAERSFGKNFIQEAIDNSVSN